MTHANVTLPRVAFTQAELARIAQRPSLHDRRGALESLRFYNGLMEAQLREGRQVPRWMLNRALYLGRMLEGTA